MKTPLPKTQALNMDSYIEAFPKEVQLRLQSLRRTIAKAAPNAVEVISYQMPAFKDQGILVYFAAYKKHIGFYPTPSAILFFQEELAGFKGAKGSVQFPHDKPLPLPLIRKIVHFRVNENMKKQR